jgi:hypothetical protein
VNDNESTVLVVDPDPGAGTRIDRLPLPRSLRGLPIRVVSGSPGGDRVAVTVKRQYDDLVAWRDLNHGGWQTVAEGGFSSPPVWAPDDGSLAVVGNPGWERQEDLLLVVSPGTGDAPVAEIRPPAPEVRDLRAVAWSPTGDRLAVSGLSEGHLLDVWVTAASPPGQKWVRLTEDGHAWFDAVAWSTDGHGVVYIRIPDKPGPPQLMEVDAAGKSPPRMLFYLRRGRGGWEAASLAPGGRVAVVEQEDSVVKIVEAGRPTRAVDLEQPPLGAYAWDAQGRRLAVVGGGHRLYVIDAESGASRLLLDMLASPIVKEH